MLNKFFSITSQKGVTMIEYALIASLVALAAITVLTPLGDQLKVIFSSVLTAPTGSANNLQQQVLQLLR